MNTFKKEERLCSQRLLNQLFKNGSSFLFYPYRITYLHINEPAVFPVQVLIHAPKKRFKQAVKRNLIKRRLREVYRLHKSLLYNQFGNKGLYLLSLQYIGKEIYAYSIFEKKWLLALNKLIKKVTEDAGNS